MNVLVGSNPQQLAASLCTKRSSVNNEQEYSSAGKACDIPRIIVASAPRVSDASSLTKSVASPCSADGVSWRDGSTNGLSADSDLSDMVQYLSNSS